MRITRRCLLFATRFFRLLFGAVVHLDTAGVGQTSAARRLRANEIAIFSFTCAESPDSGDRHPFATTVILAVQLRREHFTGAGFGIASSKLKAGRGGSRPAPFEIGVPVVGVILNHSAVVVLVTVLSILRERTHVANANRCEISVDGGRRAPALEVTRAGPFGIGVATKFSGASRVFRGLKHGGPRSDLGLCG